MGEYYICYKSVAKVVYVSDVNVPFVVKSVF